METVSVSVRCTREEYVQFSVDRVEKPWFPGAVGAFMIVMSGILQAVSEYDITAPMLLMMVCGVLALLFSPVFLVFWHKSEAARRYDNADSLRQAVALTLTADILTVRSACYEGTVPLTFITAISLTEKAIGITFGKELEICIPKRVLTEEELQFFTQTLDRVKKDNAI